MYLCDFEAIGSKRCSEQPTYFSMQLRYSGQLEVPAPNCRWCIYGNLKFREYGIGIYTMIDRYSHYVVGVFVATLVTTTVSVAKQMGNALESNGIRPEFF